MYLVFSLMLDALDCIQLHWIAFSYLLSYTEFLCSFLFKLYFCLYKFHGVYSHERVTTVLEFLSHVTVLFSKDTTPIYNPTGVFPQLDQHVILSFQPVFASLNVRRASPELFYFEVL